MRRASKKQDKKGSSAEAQRKTGATASLRRKNKPRASTHWERAPPGLKRVGRPSSDGGGGPVVQAGGADAGRVATAGVGSWFWKADT